MSDMQDVKDVRSELEDLVRASVLTADDAERASEAAKLLAEVIRIQGRVRELRSGARDRAAAPGGPFSELSLDEAARRVLEEAGVALHARELGARIKAGGWRHRSASTRPGQIVHQLAARLPRSPDVFRRVSPNTFGLALWEDTPPKPKRRPRLGLFKGPGAGIAREIGERSSEAAVSSPWRS
jgi:hypothetical protein